MRSAVPRNSPNRRVAWWITSVGLLVVTATILQLEGDPWIAALVACIGIIGSIAFLLRNASTRGFARRNDRDPRRLQVVASGPELAGQFCGAVLGPSWYEGIHPYVSARAGGILISPALGRAHTILASEILSVAPAAGIIGPWIVIDHVGVDSETPCRLMIAPASALGSAVMSLVSTMATSTEARQS
jgi:hypothetical protein